jgi:hypothetical protein
LSEPGAPAAIDVNAAPCDFGGGLDGAIDADPKLWAAVLLSATAASNRSEYVLVFQHTPKTSGTSMQEVVKANYPHARVKDLHHGRLDQRATRQWWSDQLDSLGPDDRADLLCIAGHAASYALELLDRPTKAITMLRDPVDRAISRWYFIGEKREDAPELEELVFPYFLDRFRERGYVAPWFNPQSRALLQGHYDLSDFEPTFGPPADADLWRERLWTTLERYLVGVQEAFQKSVDLFARELGWSELPIPMKKVSSYRPRAVALTRDEVDLIRAASWLDVEVHEHYARALGVDPVDAGDSPDEVRRKPYVLVEGPEDPSRAEELAWRRQLRAELTTKVEIVQAALSKQMEKRDRQVDKRLEKTKERAIPKRLDERLALLEERLSALEQLLAAAAAHGSEQDAATPSPARLQGPVRRRLGSS